MSKLTIFIMLALFSSVSFALDEAEPIEVNKPIVGELAEDVVFNDVAVFAMPAEIILDTDNNCHIFGFIVLGEEDTATRSSTGMVKRLVCKNTDEDKTEFAIWNVDGDFMSAGAGGDAQAVNIPIESSSVIDPDTNQEKTIYTAKAGTRLTVNPTKIGTERSGFHIYLFANNLTAKPFKIQLGQLPSFGGETLEDMPEIQGE